MVSVASQNICTSSSYRAKVCGLSGGKIFLFLCEQQCYGLSRHPSVSNIFFTGRGYGVNIIVSRAGDIYIYITTIATIVATIAESTQSCVDSTTLPHIY
jgi:hypothetical protein